jgi:purine-binding chemotaxis protein CheW
MTQLHVVFKLGATEYVVSADQVVQMESFTGATPVPGTAPYVAGLTQIRGRVVPIIDLRARFGLPTAAPTLDSRVVVVESSARVVGLLVDSAREVTRLDEGQLRPPPDVVDRQSHGFVKAVAQAGPRLLLVVDCPKVIGEELPHVS